MRVERFQLECETVTQPYRSHWNAREAALTQRVSNVPDFPGEAFPDEPWWTERNQRALYARLKREYDAKVTE